MGEKSAWPPVWTQSAPNFPSKFDTLSLASCSLELWGKGRSKQASGFFWRINNAIYLVTNWHVVTGLHGFRNHSLDHGWVPETVVIRHWIATKSTEGMETEQRTISVPLFVEYHQPLWHQHRRFNENRADIVVLPVSFSADDRMKVYCLNDYRFEELFHFIGMDIFVVGYPIRRETGDNSVNFAVWKRGSVASEMLLPWNGYRAFLIDCRTSAGMSGSPAYRRTFGPAVTANLVMKPDTVVTTEFVGVYSGRLDDDDGNASIGLVWDRKILQEIFSDPVSGSRFATSS